MTKYELTGAQTTELKKYGDNIDHSTETKNHLRGVDIVAVTGPSAVGVTTIIRESGLYKVPGFTSRPRRFDGETDLRFFTHTKDFVDRCIDKAKAGNLVQVRLSSEGYVYGSETLDYRQGQPNVVDMKAASIRQLGRLPIRQLIPIVVVSEPDEYQARFIGDRGSTSHHAARLQDDLESLKLTAATADQPFIVLLNPDGKVDEVTARFQDIATGECEIGDQSYAFDIRSRLIDRLEVLTKI